MTTSYTTDYDREQRRKRTFNMAVWAIVIIGAILLAMSVIFDDHDRDVPTVNSEPTTKMESQTGDQSSVGKFSAPLTNQSGKTQKQESAEQSSAGQPSKEEGLREQPSGIPQTPSSGH
jgi:hypothetical protein